MYMYKPNPAPSLLRMLLWFLVTLRIKSQIIIIQKTLHAQSLPISPHMIPIEIYFTLFSYSRTMFLFWHKKKLMWARGIEHRVKV